ncbi:MAG TPA: sigma-70 family RNA polymerase sigma factor [Acidimicrobiia bacterium]|nr:sigma-70 family RNA polymerase sigma factor [Acidimicrobiia bacterium]
MRTEVGPEAFRSDDEDQSMTGADTGELPLLRLRHQSFESFYRTQRASVLRALALTLGDRDLAADATDEAMARAFQHWKSVEGFDNQAGWVYRVGLNWARSRLRKRRRELLTDTFPQAPVEVQIKDPDLDRAVKALPLETRAVVVLRHYLDWSTDEVARALGIRPGTVKSRLHRALQDLRNQLESE